MLRIQVFSRSDPILTLGSDPGEDHPEPWWGDRTLGIPSNELNVIITCCLFFCHSIAAPQSMHVINIFTVEEELQLYRAGRTKCLLFTSFFNFFTTLY